MARSLGGQYDAGEPDDPLRGVIHLTIGPPDEGVPLQLVLFPQALTELVFRDVELLSIMDRVVPTVSWQALVMLKLYAGGPQDRLDAEQILLARQPHEHEWVRLRGMADSVGISNEWQALLDTLNRR
jgi:hypothetical protein